MVPGTNNMSYTRSLLTLAALVPCLSTPQLLAQVDEPVPAPKREENLVLEEVLVTASRRVENLQDVAMSVSAYSADFLKDTGVNQLADLEQYTPNLMITPGSDSRSTSVRIRGIGSVGTNIGIDPSVGLFIDGVYQGRAGMSISDLVDVQRIEVLRGPQGTLYGKNTAAGAISIITALPSDEFESMVELGYDSNEKAEVRGMVNFPLGNSGHAIRLSAFGIDGDHMYENTYTGQGVNDAHKWGARSRILFDLDEKAGHGGLGTLVFSLDYTKEDTDCCAFAVMDYDGLSTLNVPITNTPSAQWQEMLGPNAAGQPILQYKAFEDTAGFSPPKTNPFGDDYWFDGDVGNKVEVGGVAAEWNKDLPHDNNLTFINAWRHYETDSVYDGDFTAYDAVQGSTDIDLDQYSSELRIASPGGQTFETQGGLYAYYSEMDVVGAFGISGDLSDNIGFGHLFPQGTLNIDDNTYKTTSFAAFGQTVWNYSEQLSVTLGLRFTWEKKEREGTQKTTPDIPNIPDLPPIAGPDVVLDDSRTDSDASPSLNLRYFFNDDVMGYALVSRGFKSGGFDQRRVVSGENGEFDPEKATNYELGWKSSWGNRRLQFNGTLFYVDYEDFQAQSFDGSSIRVVNAGDLESYGAELELLFIPIENATLGSAIGYNKAEYGSFDNGQCTVEQTFEEYYIVGGAQGGAPGLFEVCTQDLAGKELDNAPEWNVSSYIQYDMELGENLDVIARLEHSYIDSYFLDQDLDPHLKNDKVDLINLRLSLTNNSGDWEVALWGRNLLDEEYYAYGIDIPTLGGFAGVTAPETTYGITLRFYN
jgi:iron complex outermembrane receptor protein